MLEILLLCVVTLTQCHTINKIPQEDVIKTSEEDVIKTLDAIDNILGWARAHYDSLILDFLFGLRIAQGELEILTQGASRQWGDNITFRLEYLQRKVTNLINLAMGTINVTKDPYYENMKRLIDQSYAFSSVYKSKQTFSLPKTQAAPKIDITFNETESDNCMIEILGSDDIEACTISMKCFVQMTHDESEEYQLTHQLLYFMLAEIRGCSSELKVLAQWQGTSIPYLMEQYTVKMYKRMKSIFDNGNFDLFSEMVLIGQMLNYEAFYTPTITELMLLWQHPSGCYIDEDLLPKEVIVHTRTVGRRLLADELIDGSCSQHFTAVCVSVLSLILQNQLLSFTPTLHPILPFYRPYLDSVTVLVIGVVLLFLLCVALRNHRLKFLRPFFNKVMVY